MHSIRLRHPWFGEWSDLKLGFSAPCVARYVRSFNSPTGLQPQQSIYVVIAPQLTRDQNGLAIPAVTVRAITLNGLQFPLMDRDDQTCADVSGGLLAFNQLEILGELAIHSPQPPPLAELAEVRIEIT